MKKMLSLLVVSVMLLAPLSVTFAEAPSQAPMFETMAQAMDESVSTGLNAWMGEYFAAIALVDGRYIRAVALVDEETALQRDALYESEDYETAFRQLDELGASLPVSYTEDISSSILPQDALDALAGKSIGELTGEGWEISSYGYGEEVEFSLRYGLFEYAFVMNESVELFEERYDTDDFDDFTVKSGRFEGVAGSALDLQYQADGTFVPNEEEEDVSSPIMDILGGLISAGESGEAPDLDALFSELMEKYPEEAETIQTLREMLVAD